MNAWIMSVLILLSAADEGHEKRRGRESEFDAIRREGSRACEMTPPGVPKRRWLAGQTARTQ